MGQPWGSLGATLLGRSGGGSGAALAQPWGSLGAALEQLWGSPGAAVVQFQAPPNWKEKPEVLAVLPCGIFLATRAEMCGQQEIGWTVIWDENKLRSGARRF